MLIPLAFLLGKFPIFSGWLNRHLETLRAVAKKAIVEMTEIMSNCGFTFYPRLLGNDGIKD